jgi:hypothetical protein
MIFADIKTNWGAEEYTKYCNMNETWGEWPNERQRR